MQVKLKIKELVWSGEIKMEMLQVMINSRHQDALQRARAAALLTIEALGAEHSLELVAVDLRIAVNAVGEIVGRTTTEDLLDAVFSQFCIGKRSGHSGSRVFRLDGICGERRLP